MIEMFLGCSPVAPRVSPMETERASSTSFKRNQFLISNSCRLPKFPPKKQNVGCHKTLPSLCSAQGSEFKEGSKNPPVGSLPPRLGGAVEEAEWFIG